MKLKRGFAMVSAIFLLVILALLGSYMVSFSSTQHVASAQDLQGSRGYRAAQLGIEWAATALCAGGSPCSTPLTDCPAASTTLDTLPDGFTVVVTCVRTSQKETGAAGDVNRYLFWITSTASSGGSVGGIGYVERSINALIEFPS